MNLLTEFHPDYFVALTSWIRAREIMAGEDTVKAAGERYLPRIQSHTNEEYDLYRQRASFFNATARTADGYLGLIFRRPPFLKIPTQPLPPKPASPLPKPVPDHVALPAEPELNGGPNPHPPFKLSTRPMPWPLAAEFAAFINDVDLIGTSFDAYAKDLVSEVLAVGRAGTLIDWQANNSRTCITRYQAEKIVNWRLEHINGRLVPTLIVLGETAQSLKADASACESFDQRRVLKLVPLSQVLHLLPREGSLNFSSIDSSWAYVVEVWQQHPTRKTTGKMEWLLIKTVVPLRRGRPLPFIPFVFHGPRHSRPDIDKPPLNDLIAVNLDHYRLDADYKHGLHYTALPTAWVSGFDKASNLKIGSSTAWVTDITGAAAGFLEFRGHGLTSFERALDRDERLMAVMGSRLLEDQKKVGETAQAIELRQSGENSILSNLASSLSQSLTQILRWVHWWHGFVDFPDSVSENEVLVTLNTDFSTKGISSDDLQAIVSAWQNGAISQDTMFELFRKGEILPEGRTNPDEARLINSQTTRAANSIPAPSSFDPALNSQLKSLSTPQK